MMSNTPDMMLKSVFFIGIKDEKGSFVPKGTGFFVMYSEHIKEAEFLYLVTAAHVIANIQQISKRDIFIRVNTKTGVEVVQVNYSDWHFHPGGLPDGVATDVAVANGEFLFAKGIDYLSAGTSLFLSKKKMEDHDVRAGDEISIVGLFRNHFGQDKNQPILRTGNIAALATDPIKTKQIGKVEGYLGELRSISGLSGCPVWHMKNRKETKFPFHLLGLMHGHFDVENIVEDTVVEDSGDKNSINTGIGVIIPAQRILETLDTLLPQHYNRTSMGLY